MFTDKTLTASSEQEATEKVQNIFPDSYVHCFGQCGIDFDVAVYDTEDDFDADAADGDNYRMTARYAVKFK